MREGYIDANLKTGLKDANPRMIRRALYIWWNDCAADALGDGYKGMTKLVQRADSMEELDPAQTMPGDIIVPESGFHTFVYLGDGDWIEADPEKGKVLRINNADRSREWRDIPVKLLRWSEL